MSIHNTEELIHKLIPDIAPDFLELRLFLNDLLDENFHPPISENNIDIFYRLDRKSCSLNNKQLSEIFDKYKKDGLIKAHQVPAYLASLGKITNKEIEKIARKWAAYNVQVLLGLARIRDQDDKYDLLCTRFRLAQTEEPHYWLWQALPDLPLSLGEIARKLTESTIKSKGSDLILEMPLNGLIRIGEIRKAYKTFLSNIKKRNVTQTTRKRKIDPSIETKRVSLQTDNSSFPIDELDLPLEDETNGVDSREQRDDQQGAFLVDNGLKPPKIARFSNGMQRKALRMQVSHIIRQKFLFPTDLKVLPLPASQQIFANLWAGLNRKDSVDTCLLLSMLTVTNAEIWMDVETLFKQRKIREVQGLEECYWHSILDISNLKLTQIVDFKKNSEREFELPLPYQAIEVLKEMKPSSQKCLQNRVSDLRRTLDIPSLSLEKIQFTLRHVIKRHTSDHLIADLICDASPRHSPAIYYASVAVQEIEAEYAKATLKLAEGIANFDASYLKSFNQSDFCGSQQTPQLRLVKSFFKLTRQRVQQQTNHFRQFNEYTLWMWHLFLLLTSIRPVNHAPGFLDQIDTHAGLIWVSDKENRTTGASGRFIPLCPFLIEAIEDYTQYLEDFHFKYGMVDLSINRTLRKSFSSKRPLLHLFNNQKKLDPITPGFVKTLMTDIFPLPLNWERHFGRDYLSNNTKLSIYLIDAIFGHEPPDQEMLNPYSSISINELKTAATAYEQMAQDLQLQRMNINVI